MVFRGLMVRTGCERCVVPAMVIFAFSMRFVVCLGAMKHFMHYEMLRMFVVEVCFTFNMPDFITFSMDNTGRRM